MNLKELKELRQITHIGYTYLGNIDDLKEARDRVSLIREYIDKPRDSIYLSVNHDIQINLKNILQSNAINNLLDTLIN